MLSWLCRQTSVRSVVPPVLTAICIVPSSGAKCVPRNVHAGNQHTGSSVKCPETGVPTGTTKCCSACMTAAGVARVRPRRGDRRMCYSVSGTRWPMPRSFHPSLHEGGWRNEQQGGNAIPNMFSLAEAPEQRVGIIAHPPHAHHRVGPAHR